MYILQLNSISICFVECQENWYGFGENCYSVQQTEAGVSWNEAEKGCQSLGGHLVSIADQSEMDFIHYLITVVAPGFGNKAFIG